jgi:hypothetical protein
MTVHAVVVCASTVIGSYVTAEITLVLDVCVLVFVTVGYAELLIRILAKKFAFGAL